MENFPTFLRKKFNVCSVKENNCHFKAGFSLIELILYVALIAIFISGAILFAWDIIFGRVKSQIQQEVNQNLRLASKRLTFEIRNAAKVNSIGNSTISLEMSDAARNPTVFDVKDGRLRIGYGSGGACPVTAPCPLTSNQVTVSQLSFTDLSTADGNSVNIQYIITIKANNPGGRQEWERSQTYSSSVELRSN